MRTSKESSSEKKAIVADLAAIRADGSHAITSSVSPPVSPPVSPSVSSQVLSPQSLTTQASRTQLSDRRLTQALQYPQPRSPLPRESSGRLSNTEIRTGSNAVSDSVVNPRSDMRSNTVLETENNTATSLRQPMRYTDHSRPIYDPAHERVQEQDYNQAHDRTYDRGYNQTHDRIYPQTHDRTHNSEQQLHESVQRLETQAQRINQLSEEQESAIWHLRELVEQVERDWQAADLDSAAQAGYRLSIADLEVPPIWEYQDAIVPHVERDQDGVLVLTSRSIELHQAEQEANLLAQALRSGRHRHLQSQSQLESQSQSSLWQQMSRWCAALLPSSSTTPRLNSTSRSALNSKSLRSNYASVSQSSNSQSSNSQSSNVQSSNVQSSHRSLHHQLEARRRSTGISRRASRQAERQTSRSYSFTLKEGVTLLIGAIVTRVLMQAILNVFPQLFLPFVLILMAPAVIGVYRATVAPRSGFVWGCRLFCIMVGLLIGGRL